MEGRKQTPPMTQRPKLSLPRGKTPTKDKPGEPRRAPVRGHGSAPRTRPTLAQAQHAREERRAAASAVEEARPRKSAKAPDQGVAPKQGHARPAPQDAPREPRPEAAPAGPAPEHEEGSLRLSKRMGELGLASRREADEWIARGWVRVDGKVVSELGSRVLPHQQITVDPAAHAMQAKQVTILINKPVGVVSGQAEDGYEPAIALVTPENHWRGDPTGLRFSRDHLRNLAPAGRLDIDSVGLLVLTQDGRVAKRLIGEDSEVDKEYLVRVEYPARTRPGPLPEVFPEVELARLNHGLWLDGKPLRPAEVHWQNEDQLRFVLREGKKRQIRRMCEAVGLKVVGLKRVRIGHVMLGDLPPAQWRYLRGDEKF